MSADLSFPLGDQRLSAQRHPFIVAELSANHGGTLAHALATVEAIAKAGADGLKLQTYTPAEMTLARDTPPFLIDEPSNPWRGRTLYDLYQEAHTPWEWHAPLFQRAHELGLLAFSTPFSQAGVANLETLAPPCYKIASFEFTDTPLLEAVAATGRPLILSTGMATLAEIDQAIRTCRTAGARHIMLLRCTSAYPAPAEQANLRSLPVLQQITGCPVGLSDHTLGSAVAITATSLGAVLIEKHVTLERAAGGPDAGFSLEPAELAQLVRDTTTAWQALGQLHFGPVAAEQGTQGHRRSLYVTADLWAGERLNEHNLQALRPALGLPPSYYALLLGRRVRRDIPAGTAVTWSLLLDDE